MGNLRVYCLKTLKKPSIYPLGKIPSAPSDKDPKGREGGQGETVRSGGEGNEIRSVRPEGGEENEIGFPREPKRRTRDGRNR